MADINVQAALNRILNGLRSADTIDQLAALNELAGINYSSEAILIELEKFSDWDA